MLLAMFENRCEITRQYIEGYIDNYHITKKLSKC
jgi:hypothetical protein